MLPNGEGGGKSGGEGTPHLQGDRRKRAAKRTQILLVRKGEKPTETWIKEKNRVLAE